MVDENTYLDEVRRQIAEMTPREAVVGQCVLWWGQLLALILNNHDREMIQALKAGITGLFDQAEEMLEKHGPTVN